MGIVAGVFYKLASLVRQAKKALRGFFLCFCRSKVYVNPILAFLILKLMGYGVDACLGAKGTGKAYKEDSA